MDRIARDCAADCAFGNVGGRVGRSREHETVECRRVLVIGADGLGLGLRVQGVKDGPGLLGTRGTVVGQFKILEC
jgi:hypothetical protein